MLRRGSRRCFLSIPGSLIPRPIVSHTARSKHRRDCPRLSPCNKALCSNRDPVTQLYDVLPADGGQAMLPRPVEIRSSDLAVHVFPAVIGRAGKFVPTSPVVPTLSQPPEGVGDTKSRSKTTVSPTSPRRPNLLLHIHVGERKRSGTCFSIRKEKDPRWGHRGWDHIHSSHWSKTIKGCPNPLEGWDHAVGGWDRDGQRVDRRRPRRPWSFSLWPRTAECYILR